MFLTLWNHVHVFMNHQSTECWCPPPFLTAAINCKKNLSDNVIVYHKDKTPYQLVQTLWTKTNQNPSITHRIILLSFLLSSLFPCLFIHVVVRTCNKTPRVCFPFFLGTRVILIYWFVWEQKKLKIACTSHAASVFLTRLISLLFDNYCGSFTRIMFAQRASASSLIY